MSEKKSGDLPDILSVDQTAEYLQLSVTTVYRLLKKGAIPAQRYGNKWRFSKEALKEHAAGKKE